MKKFRYGPARPLRNEVLSLLPAAAFAAALALAFPREALTWNGGAPAAADGPASCAFVELSGDAALRARDMVRSPFLPAGPAARELRADLSVSTVAEDAPESIFDVSSRLRPAPPPRQAWRETPLPQGLSAPQPAFAPLQPAAQEPAFPRSGMIENRLDPEAAARPSGGQNRKEQRQ